MKIFNFVLTQKFKKDLLFSYLAKFLVALFGFLNLYLINNYFGLDIYGKLTVIASIAGIFSSIVSARSSEAVTKFLKKEELNNNLQNAKLVLTIGLIVDVVTTIFFLLIMYLSSNFIALKFLKDINLSFYIILYSFVSSISFLKGTFIGFLQAREEFTIINFDMIIESFFRVLILLLVIFFFSKYGILELIFVQILGAIVSFSYITCNVMKIYKINYTKIRIKPDNNLIKEYLKYNIKTFTSTTLKAGTQNIDNLILSYFLTTQIVGVYQTIKKLFQPISMLIAPIPMLTFPKFVYYFEIGNHRKIKDVIYKIILILLSVTLIYELSLFVAIEKVFRLLNLQCNLNTLNIFYWISFLTLFCAIGWWVRTFSNTVDPMFSVYASVIMIGFKLLVYPILVNYFNIYGLFYSEFLMSTTILLWWFSKLGALGKLVGAPLNL